MRNTQRLGKKIRRAMRKSDTVNMVYADYHPELEKTLCFSEANIRGSERKGARYPTINGQSNRPIYYEQGRIKDLWGHMSVFSDDIHHEFLVTTDQTPLLLVLLKQGVALTGHNTTGPPAIIRREAT